MNRDTLIAVMKQHIYPEPSANIVCDVGGFEEAADAILALGEAATPSDPTASAEWNNGCDFAMEQLCKFLDVDTTQVSWDAATETVDGDVQAVIGNILRAKFGEDWGPDDVAQPKQQWPASLPPKREVQKLIEGFIAPDLDTEKAFATHRRSWMVQCLQALLTAYSLPSTKR